uniref:Ovule protein n=1 Tax=Angiostrongylus cantonensis TaxID=6313 RepID=A0A0K0DKF6_ANGCA
MTKKKSKRSAWTWRNSAEKTIHSSKSSLEISTPRLGQEEFQKNVTLGPHGLEWNEQGKRLSEFTMATKTIMAIRNSRSSTLNAEHRNFPMERTITK